MVAERSVLRSVHRECAGRVMEPRKISPARAPTSLVRRKAGSTHRSEAGCEELAGVEERGMHTMGFPRNLGDLIVSVQESRDGHPVE